MGPSVPVTIPCEIDGLTVSCIGSYAFDNDTVNTSPTSITLLDNIKNIEDEAVSTVLRANRAEYRQRRY